MWTHALHFWCLNPAVVFGGIGEAAHSVIVASGTLSPLSSFQSELGVPFPIQLEASHVIKAEQVRWEGRTGEESSQDLEVEVGCCEDRQMAVRVEIRVQGGMNAHKSWMLGFGVGRQGDLTQV